MSLQIDLTAIENNDESYMFQATYNGAPLSLSSYTPTLYLKSSRTATDASGVTFGVGTGLTVTNSLLGEITAAIPRSNFPASAAGTVLWYRLDIAAGGLITTLFFGNVTVLSA